MKKGRILIVDDNQGIRNALKILLPAYFAQVELIASPKTLISTMESFRPDVVLLDLNFYTDINTGNEGLYWTGELTSRSSLSTMRPLGVFLTMVSEKLSALSLR